MNTRRVNAAAGVIHAAQKNTATSTGLAFALEAACLLQSPETAAEQLAQLRELDALRLRVAGLEATLSRLGARAEQRHLIDPLDHVLEHLADNAPADDRRAESVTKLRGLLARQSGGAL